MATKTKMTVKKVPGNGDTNLYGTTPKPTYKKIEGAKPKPNPPKSETDKYLKTIESRVGKKHPVTGRIMTKADVIKMDRELEYQKKNKNKVS